MNPIEEAKRKFPVPVGFQALLEAFTREMLRFQPSDIYQFSSVFFEALNKVHLENVDVDPVKNAQMYQKVKSLMIVEAHRRKISLKNLPMDFAECDDVGVIQRTESEELPNLASFTEQDSLAISKIQNRFRANRESDPANLSNQMKMSEPLPRTTSRPHLMKEELAATKIQATFRGFKVRSNLNKELSKSSGRTVSKSTTVDESVEKVSVTTRSSTSQSASRPPSADEAAAKIQAGVRGYLTRKEMQTKKKAATTIQAGVRGYLTRKHLKGDNVPGKISE